MPPLIEQIPFDVPFFGQPRLAGFPQGQLPKSQPIITRFQQTDLTSIEKQIQDIQRGEFGDDPAGAVVKVLQEWTSIQRAIQTNTPNLPIRENLEAEITALVPTDTPLRNRIPRVPGAGRAVNWRQLASYGGGWGTSGVQLGGGTAAQAFFGERGAPSEVSSQYLNKVATYKLMGIKGSVTGLAMAQGANFMNQYATERTNSMVNMMLLEENAILNGDSTSIVAPWGDGTNALAFDGIINLVTTANGTPSAQVQTSVGALTFSFIDGMLKLIYEKGGRNIWMTVSTQEALSIQHLAIAQGMMRKIIRADKESAGVWITHYVHPMTGEAVEIIVDRFMPAGTMIFGCDKGLRGENALEIEVLPQVQLPELAPNVNIQGFTAQDLAPTQDSPQVFAWLISVYQVLKIKNANLFGKATGVTAV